MGTHIVLSEFIDGDLRLHEVVVEEDNFPAEGSLFLLMVLGLQRKRKNRRGRREIEKKEENKTQDVRGRQSG